MQTTNYSLTNILNSKQLESGLINSEKKKFLFITNSVIDYPFQQTSHISEICTSFEKAKNLLIENALISDMIVIDMPLQHLELVQFKVWLTANKLNHIPIIYNETALNQEHINQLFKQKLVDDVMLLDKNFDKLSQKVIFFEKYLLKNGYTEKEDEGLNKQQNCRISLLTRSIDIVLSSIAIIFFSPLILFIAIVIKFESKGPIFYTSKRAGRGFKVFNFYKFRTMVVDADKKIDILSKLNQYSDGNKKVNFFKVKDDPRITKVGALLRKTSIDELPQLFNVLKGDMSIVGNRPLPLYEATTLTTDEWAERFMAPAGITGLWQISKRGKEDMSNEERILLDIKYARSRSIIGDLKILFKTPGALIQKSNV